MKTTLQIRMSAVVDAHGPRWPENRTDHHSPKHSIDSLRPPSTDRGSRILRSLFSVDEDGQTVW